MSIINKTAFKAKLRYNGIVERYGIIIVSLVMVIVAAGVVFLVKPSYVLAPGGIVLEGSGKTNQDKSLKDKEVSFPKKLASPPSIIKGIYITGWVAGTESRISSLIDLINSTELNTVVIDVKDYSGYLSFKTNISLAQEVGAHNEPRIRDINSLIERLHKNNIYVIARVQVFQDPVLALARPDLAVSDDRTGKPWRDDKGLSWLDPASHEVWDYTVDIAKEANMRGFDEVNLDYIRFPSDGNLKVMAFPFWDEETPRHEIIESFYKYFREKTREDNIKISADVFGMTAWNALKTDYDLGIGQRLVDAVGYFDFVSPMVYPSHYQNLGTGFANPALYPYEIVSISLTNAQQLVASTSPPAQLRPWLQDFDLGADYDAEKVRAQIRATNDAGIDGWLLWNASNYYTKNALNLE